MEKRPELTSSKVDVFNPTTLLDLFINSDSFSTNYFVLSTYIILGSINDVSLINIFSNS